MPERVFVRLWTDMEMENGWDKERLYQLVDNVREYAIFASDTSGVIRSWNPGVEEIFGYTAEEFIGQDGSIIFVPEDRDALEPEREMRDAADTGRASDERWHLKKDGSRIFVSGIQSALRDDSGKLTGFVKICRDLSNRIQLEEQLHGISDSVEQTVAERTADLAAANKQLQVEVVDRKESEARRIGLLRRIVRTQEDERKRIARAIHDQIGQQMTVLKLRLKTLATYARDLPAISEHLTSLETVANQIDSDVGFLAWELRPSVLDDLGLAPALRKFVWEWSQHFKINAEFRTVDWHATMLVPEIEINLYRIAQEALNNISKHARAENVSVIVEERDGMARLIVEDDGVGFDPDAAVVEGADGAGMGLIGMRERAELLGGEIEIESVPGGGTTVFARIPARFEDS